MQVPPAGAAMRYAQAQAPPRAVEAGWQCLRSAPETRSHKRWERQTTGAKAGEAMLSAQSLLPSPNSTWLARAGRLTWSFLQFGNKLSKLPDICRGQLLLSHEMRNQRRHLTVKEPVQQHLAFRPHIIFAADQRLVKIPARLPRPCESPFAQQACYQGA